MMLEPFSVRILPAQDSEELVDTPIPLLRKVNRNGAIKRRLTVREQVTAVVNNAAPDIDTGPVIEAVLNMAKEKGWK